MNNQRNLNIAWVVGVNQGIGFTLMHLLLSKGIKVIGIDKSLDNLSTDLQKTCYICDVSDESQIKSICKKLLSKYPPDYFIHVAGVLYSGNYDEISSWELQQTFAINIFSPFYFLKNLSPYLKEKKRGSIVLVSSNAAHTPRMGLSVYGSSKAALTSFAKTAALELATYGIRLNIVSPGSTATPMLNQLWTDNNSKMITLKGDLDAYRVGIPLNKLASTNDICQAIFFLLSDEANHITMHDLVIDGGATLGC